MDDLSRKIQKARTMMAMALPFVASAIMMLKLEEDPSIETAETDGNSIFYNPTFLNSLRFRQIMWVLAHESLHCVLLHHIRTGSRDKKLWNVAADYVINLILNEMKPLEFVEGCLLDFAYLNKATEEVYNILNQLSKEQKKKFDNYKDVAGFRKPSAGGAGDKKSDKGEKAGDGKQSAGKGEKKKSTFGTGVDGQEEKWQIFNKQSVDVVKKMGGFCEGIGSAALERLINSIVNPVVPWNTYLYMFVDQISKNEYNWNRFNKRHIASGYYFPTLYSEELGYVVVAVDTSGSIRPSDLDRFAAEVEAIKQAYKCKILVLYCDSKIAKVEEFDEYDEIKLKPSGGGGTNFVPPFKYIEDHELSEEVKCMIYFTDGICSSYPKYAPDFPVLWVGMRKFEPKFGDFIFMESI